MKQVILKKSIKASCKSLHKTVTLRMGDFGRKKEMFLIEELDSIVVIKS